MSKYEIFDIGKAEKLIGIYKKNRHYAKTLLLAELISWQYFFGNKSIAGVKISPKHCYSKKTVKTVLDDLGYMLTSYKTGILHPLVMGNSEKYVEFTFIPKDSQTAEG